jgi:shikimate dehydrogenase
MDHYGLIGEKLSHSLSPKIHSKIFEFLNMQAVYNLFEIPVEDIHSCVNTIRFLKIKGANITIPYKQLIIDDLDELSIEAKRIGAVNTIANHNGVLTGYNTDYFGFKVMLSKNSIDVAGRTAVVLGTGGAAQAVLTCLKDLEANKIFAVTRNKQDKKTTFYDIEVIDYNELKNIKGYILINTTPVGMYPKVGISPVSENIIDNYKCLVDLIYNPKETEFIKLGEKVGKITCGGLHMLIWQAIKAQEIWQHTKINEEIFFKIFDALNK